MSTPTAAQLTREYLRLLCERDVDGILSLLAPGAVSEFPFAPEGTPAIHRSAESAGAFIRLVVERLIASVSISDIDVVEVNDGLAFAEFRSENLTKKGLVYANRYIVRIEATEGLITLWREYFDPRATASVK